MTAQVSHDILTESRELTNEHGTPDDGRNATTERSVQHDGQGLIDNDIGQQQCHQDPMLALIQQIQHPPRVLVLRLVRIALDNLQVNAVLSHQAMPRQSQSIAHHQFATHAIVNPAKTPPTNVNANDATAIIQSGVPPAVSSSLPPWPSEVRGAAATVA